VTADTIKEALKQVKYPGFSRDIVSFGLVRSAAFADGTAQVAVAITTSDPKVPTMLKAEIEKCLRALPGVKDVIIELAVSAAKAPPSPGQSTPGGGTAPTGLKHSVAIASGKGGVGKSTTAVNLALGLAANGLKVGILDADIYGPSMPRMLGISGKPNSRDGRVLEPMQNYGVKCMSMGFLVAEDTPMIWRGPMVMSALNQMLRDVNWGDLDILVVDLPPGTGDAQLTMAQQVPLSGAVIVSTPQDIALLDARKGLNMFRKVDVPVLGIIENMSYFSCPNCGHRSEIFSHGGARREAEKLGVEFLCEVPLDIAIRETSDEGTPIVVSQPDSEHAKAYRLLAQRVWEKVAGVAQRQAPRIVVQ